MLQTLLWPDIALPAPGVLIDAGLDACVAFSPCLWLCAFPGCEDFSFTLLYGSTSESMKVDYVF